MTEEEKEEIERCKELIKIEHANWIGMSNQNAIEIVLNLIEKQQSEMFKLQAKADRLKVARDNWKKTFYQAKAEIEKKDKMIDEMANKLHKLALYYDNEGTYCEIKNEICDELDNLNHVEDIHKHCTSCIKEYFKKRVEEK